MQGQALLDTFELVALTSDKVSCFKQNQASHPSATFFSMPCFLWMIVILMMAATVAATVIVSVTAIFDSHLLNTG